MTLFALKVILTPLLILVATLAARRWGPVVGGLLVGLPLTSGPTSVFLALEQGSEFAAHAAHSTLFGGLAGIAFCVCYARLAGRFRWTVTVAVSLCVYFAGVALVGWITLPSLWPSVLIMVLLLMLSQKLVPPVTTKLLHPAAPRWDLPFRVVVSTAIVIGVTALSMRLGPQMSGIVSGVPAIVCVMSVFTHELYGPPAVRQFERGVITGTYAYTIFFLTVALTVEHWNYALVYLVATGVAAAINLGICVLNTRRNAACATM